MKVAMFSWCLEIRSFITVVLWCWRIWPGVMGWSWLIFFSPLNPPLSVVRITGHWTDHHPQHENRAWTEYTTTYNKHRRSVHWAIRASVAREERLAALISPEGVFWNLICMGSRPRRSDEQADAKWGVELKRDLYAKSNVFEGLGTNTSLGWDS